MLSLKVLTLPMSLMGPECVLETTIYAFGIKMLYFDVGLSANLWKGKSQVLFHLC